MSSDGTEPALAAAFNCCQLISVGIIPSNPLLFRTTSLHCEVIIHVSLCLWGPEGEEGRGCRYFSFFACFPGSVCFGLMAHLKVTAPKGVLHTPVGLKIDLAGFLRHCRRILASAHFLWWRRTPPPRQSTDKPDFSACTFNTAWNHSCLWHLHHSLVS